jgi:hypothetical protein
LDYFPTEPNAINATDQVVVFMKDTNFQIGERTFGDMLSLAVLNGLGCMKKDWIPSVINRYDVLRQMTVDVPVYSRNTGERGHAVEVPFHNETFQNLGDWVDKLQISSIISTQNLVSVCCGAFFAITKLYGRPLRKVYLEVIILWKDIMPSDCGHAFCQSL